DILGGRTRCNRHPSGEAWRRPGESRASGSDHNRRERLTSAEAVCQARVPTKRGTGSPALLVAGRDPPPGRVSAFFGLSVEYLGPPALRSAELLPPGEEVGVDGEVGLPLAYLLRGKEIDRDRRGRASTR